MKTQVLRVNCENPEPEIIAEAAAVLFQGGLVAFPTETVYGLGAHALDPVAVARIFAAKGRPPGNPIIIHIADISEARQLALEWPDTAEHLAQHFWPGPLTLVVKKNCLVPELVTAGGPTVGLRIPAHPIAYALLRAAEPIAAPSANRSTQLSATRAEHVLQGLDGLVDMVLDGGPTPGGIESTVVDVTVTPPRLLRPGLISLPDLEALIGPVSQAISTTEPLRSPGMMERHYAPRATLVCREVGFPLVEKLTCQGFLVGWVTFRDTEPQDPAPIRVIRLPREPVGYAAGLYAALHALDAAGIDRIVVDLPPQEPEWLAIHDRLRRAATAEK